MRYFKNSEVVRLYNISDKTVRNWIAATQDGKIDLDLFEHKEKSYIADTISNAHILTSLVERSRKYRNTLAHKDLTPLAEFYDTYSPRQVIEIINDLEIHREYPTLYRFFGEGGRYYNSYLRKLYTSSQTNALTTAINLLKLEEDYLENLVGKYDFVNIVDVGTDNGLVSKELVSFVIRKNKLARYIKIYSSNEMLDIAEKNSIEWFGKKATFEKYVRDISCEKFPEVLAANSFNQDGSRTLNLVLSLTGDGSNLRHPEHMFRTLSESMRKEDVLIFGEKLDTENSRRFFDFNIHTDKAVLPYYNKIVIDRLAIDPSLYEIEHFFDKEEKCRFTQIRLKTDITLHFKTNTYQKALNFKKGETIKLWRFHQHSFQDVVDLHTCNNLDIMRTSLSEDKEYVLSMSRLRPVI
ncbi:MAG TPA: hypothetical protein VJP80_06070 [Candidatus Saccharimonadales bacterium]|nr:hypothetical protein [Candidatus Saccharimonadales bacterium]